MRSWTPILVAAALAGTLALPARARHSDRRDRKDPELVVESGGRRGACDVLTFTADGRRLLAVGDDKVVRVWRVTAGGLEPDDPPVLRWSAWREQRGAIYALALSPDPEGRRLAVGGLGARTSSVVVLDRASGEVLHATDPKAGRDRATGESENFYAVTALAFAPSGKRLAYGTADGSVWVWDFKTSRRAGKHRGLKRAGKLEAINEVRFLRFTDETHLLSVAANRDVVRWDLAALPAAGTLVEGLLDSPHSVFRATLSPDGKWLAAATKGPDVLLRSLDGKGKKDIRLKDGEFPRGVTFDPSGRRLAVAVGSARGRFRIEGDDQIRLYDCRGRAPVATAGPPHRYRADFLAFHPDGKRLAVAGGDDHEVTLWDLGRKEQPLSVMRGAGRCLWGVALSKDGLLGFRDQRKAGADPSARGAGPWRVFDLQRRRWTDPRDFTPVGRLKAPKGWSVRPDPKDPYRWYVVSPKGKELALPLDRQRDGMPRCYAFLPPRRGSDVRLAVGHYWGLSIYEVTATKARRTRLCVGHQGEVTALALSDDRKWLVSASNDQTVSAWSLASWRGEAELGAAFELRRGRLCVKAVDLFSPAWEAGLVEGDEVVLLAVANEKVFDRDGSKQFGRATGKPADALKALARPEPGKELVFGVHRGKRKELLVHLTTVRQRPLWRFFPTRDREWVLWMWRYHYYDTSTNGDSFVGWHLNNGASAEKKPTFYRAEQLRERFHRPAVLDKLLLSRDVKAALDEAGDGLAPPDFRGFEPPAVRMRLSADRVTDQDLTVTLTADPQNDNPDLLPQRAELWVNGHRFRRWLPQGRRFEATVKVPREVLWKGANQLTFQCYNRVAGRGEGRAEANAAVECARPEPRRRLFGVVVGFADYSKSRALKVPGLKDLPDLPGARRDAEEVRRSWLGRKDPLYQEGRLELVTDGGREAILRRLEGLAGRVRADDVVLLFLAGHGDLHEAGGKSTFVFCCPDYDPRRYAATGVTSADLYEKLAAIPCRKVVLLDACRSGDLAASPVRDLTPGGKGPTILAACGRGEKSFEDTRLGKAGHGLFSFALIEALGEKFDAADKSPADGRLDAQEIFDYVEARLPALLKDVGKEGAQNPTHFPAELDRRHPLLGKVK
jgi:WD40 repeat protein